MVRPKQTTEKLSFKEIIVSIGKVLKLSFSISKSAMGFKLVSMVLDSVIPLVLVFLAARTTTEIVNAFNGVPGASGTVIWLVIATAVMGFVTQVQSSINNYVDQIVRFKIESRISDLL